MQPRSRYIKILIAGNSKAVEKVMSLYLGEKSCSHRSYEGMKILHQDNKLVHLTIFRDPDAQSPDSEFSSPIYYIEHLKHIDKADGIVWVYDAMKKKSFQTIAELLRLAANKKKKWEFALIGTQSYLGSQDNQQVDEKAAQVFYAKKHISSCVINKDNYSTINPFFENFIQQITARNADENEIKINTSTITRIKYDLILNIIEKRFSAQTLQELAQTERFKEDVLSYLTHLRQANPEKFNQLFALNTHTQALESFFSIKRSASIKRIFNTKNTMERFIELQKVWIKDLSKAKNELSQVTINYLYSLANKVFNVDINYLYSLENRSDTIAERIKKLELSDYESKFFNRYQDPVTTKYIVIPVALVSPRTENPTYFDFRTLEFSNQNPVTGEVFFKQEIKPGIELLLEFNEFYDYFKKHRFNLDRLKKFMDNLAEAQEAKESDESQKESDILLEEGSVPLIDLRNIPPKEEQKPELPPQQELKLAQKEGPSKLSSLVVLKSLPKQNSEPVRQKRELDVSQEIELIELCQTPTSSKDDQSDELLQESDLVLGQQDDAIELRRIAGK